MYFIIHYMTVDKDLWRPLTQDNYNLLADLWLETLESQLGIRSLSIVEQVLLGNYCWPILVVTY